MWRLPYVGMPAVCQALRGLRVLELGAGTGIPGVMLAALGSHVSTLTRILNALSITTLVEVLSNVPQRAR